MVVVRMKEANLIGIPILQFRTWKSLTSDSYHLLDLSALAPTLLHLTFPYFPNLRGILIFVSS